MVVMSIHDEVFKSAAPLCKECDEPIRNTEFRWYRTDENEWAILYATMVCPNNHRMLVYDAR